MTDFGIGDNNVLSTSMNAIQGPEADRPRFFLVRWSICSAIASLPVCAALGFTGNLDMDIYHRAPPTSQAILAVVGYGPIFAFVAAIAGLIVGSCVGLIRRWLWLRK